MRKVSVPHECKKRYMIFIYHLLYTIYREEISHKYANKRDEIFPYYAFLVLLDERQSGRIPAWEGIRIVRERVE